MSIAILATGDEIINGDTLNTSTQEMARTLTSEGLTVNQHMSCTDNQADIEACIHFLTQHHDTLIITGGLGPTSDDRTRFALAAFLKEPLESAEEAVCHIHTILHAKKSRESKSNLQQTFFPKGATLLPNPFGTAMGCYFSRQDKHFALLPGPPAECFPMFHHHLLPLIQHERKTDLQMLKWRVFGLAESEIASEIDEAMKDLPCETGYRLDVPYLECKVRCKKEDITNVKQRMEPIVRPHIISSVEKRASQELVDYILQHHIRFSITDHASGGRLQMLIQTPETLPWVEFNPKKKQALHFDIEGLDAYWHQGPKDQKTSMTIRYSQHGKQGEIHDPLPYRSRHVIYMAAEWSAFRLLQLINQLHQ